MLKLHARAARISGATIGGMTNLERLLGRPISQLTTTDFERLVKERAPEGTQLDFKQEPYTDGRDFAGDVAALGNSVGGAIVIGIKEADGAAGKLVLTDLSEEQVLRMQQWLASYLLPRLDVEVLTVKSPEDPQRGLYVVEVPRSPRAPHALVRDASLRYYRRSGPRNRPLSEPEVAEAYDSRFRHFQARAERMKTLAGGAASFAYDGGEHSHAWVVVNLLPAYPGSMEISARRLGAIEDWANRMCKTLRRSSIADDARAFPTMGCVLVTTRPTEGEAPWGYYLRLYADGAASVAAQLMPFTKKRAGGDVIGYGIFADDLVRTTAECVRVAAAHAVENTGARDEALANCQLSLRRAPTSLGFARWDENFDSWEPYSPERPFNGADVGNPCTVSTDAILGDPTEWMLATRRVLSDIFHLAGQPEVRQIDESGAVNTAYWGPRLLQGWKAVEKVARVNVNLRR